MNIKEETKILQGDKIAKGKNTTVQTNSYYTYTLTNNYLANPLPQREVTMQPTLSPSEE